MKNIIQFILLLCFAPCLSGQNLQTDIKKMHQTYQENVAFSCEMDIRVFNSNQLFTTKKAKVSKSAENYLYSLDDRTMLMNHQYTLMIDKNNKIIVLDELDENAIKQKNERNQTVFDNLDSLLNQYQDWTFLGESGGRKSYLFTLPNGSIKRVKLVLHSKNHTLQELVYYYDEGTDTQNRVNINFSKVRLQPQFASNHFSEKKFITKIDSKWSGTKRFHDYEVIQVNQDM